MSVGFAKKLKMRISDLIKLEKPDVLSSRYGKAFERAVLVLLKARDAAVAIRTLLNNTASHTAALLPSL
jgi:hypothetical protein